VVRGCFAMNDAIHPKHYKEHPSGVECIDIAEHFGFNLGNAIKYIWRAGLKGDSLEDLKKAEWYLKRQIKNIEGIKCEQKSSITDTLNSSKDGAAT